MRGKRLSGVVIEDEVVVVVVAGEGVTIGPFIDGAFVDPGVGSREVLLTSTVLVVARVGHQDLC